MSRSPVWVRTLEELSVIHLLGFPISSVATGAFLVPSLAFLDLARAGESARSLSGEVQEISRTLNLFRDLKEPPFPPRSARGQTADVHFGR